MHTFRILIVILSVSLYPLSTMFAQINVYTQGCNSITTAQYSSGNTFNAGCYELPSNSGQTYSTSTQKEVVAEDYILLENDIEFTASGSGQADLRIEELPYEVVAFTNSLDGIKKLDKFEIGLTLPEFYSEAVKNFINKSGSPQINPFLSHQIEIKAMFTHVEYDTVVYDMYPDPPETVIYTNVTEKLRHGFFTTDITRDISRFDSLYNDPFLSNSNIYVGQAYENLGGGWTETYSAYPFRIRFAPPKVGMWTCIIQVNILNGTAVYETPPFTFNVIDSNIPDYLRVGKNGRWLIRDGMTYIPCGPNYPFVIRNGYPLKPNDGVNYSLISDPNIYAETAPIAAYEQYLRYIDTLAMNGANYFRMIMNPWGLDIEYEELGDYSGRMHIANEMDLILERAQNNGMLIHWNLMVHYGLQTNPFSITAWDWSFDAIPGASWSTSTNGYCYNDELNLSSPIEFFSDTEAIKYYKERIRYIVARWGYSPTVGMFEHMSEIDQVGTEHDASGDEISGTNQYRNQPANQQLIKNWHGLMSKYMKDELEIPHLLTLSYTEAIDVDGDQSFSLSDIDVISMNNYNNYKTDVHGYYRNQITKRVPETTGFDPHIYGDYDKPLIFSESGALNLWGCAFIETRRNIWQNMFWGIAGAFDWEIERLPENMKDLSIYGRIKEFFNGVDLEGGNWHSGITKLDNNDLWIYKSDYLDDCIRKDELADVVYLRSGDKEKAMGVITNRRANYWTKAVVNDCKDVEGNLLNPPVHSDFDPQIQDEFAGYTALLQTYGPLTSGTGSNTLRLRNMKALKNFTIRYYSPYDQVNPLKEESFMTELISPVIPLNHPAFDTLDIILFEVFPEGENFKSSTNNTSSSNRILHNVSGKNEVESQEVLVYPNPNDGSFTLFLQKYEEVESIKIYNSFGQIIVSTFGANMENRFQLANCKPGVFFIEVLYSNRIVRKKITIK